MPSHIFSRRFLKQNYTKYIRDAVSKILKKKAELLVLLSEFVILLKLGVLWGKLKIFITNFFHVLPDEFSHVQYCRTVTDR